MSDTFDHMGDAWDSYDRAQEDGPTFGRRRGSRGPTYRPPPSYTDVPVVNQIAVTDKAYLLVLTLKGKNHERWIPKSRCIYKFADVIQIEDWLMSQILKEIS